MLKVKSSYNFLTKAS